MRQRLVSVTTFYGSRFGRALAVLLIVAVGAALVGQVSIAVVLVAIAVGASIPLLSDADRATQRQLDDLNHAAADLDHRIRVLRTDVERRPTKRDLKQSVREVRREQRDVTRSLRERQRGLRQTLNAQEESDIETRTRLDHRRAAAQRLQTELHDLHATVAELEDRFGGLKGSVGSLVERQQRLSNQLMEEQTTLVSDGSAAHFHLAPGYRRRSALSANFDDTENEDLWQREVYDHALDVATEIGAARIGDFGCGSGFKLMERFTDFDTVGIDVPSTVEFLRRTYPDRTWQETAALTPALFDSFDVVIASDVIEHLEDPTALLRALAGSSVREIVLSTPARELLVAKGHRRLGPPGNVHHYLEWTVEEFGRLVADHLQIVRHEISNAEQATQMVHARRID